MGIEADILAFCDSQLLSESRIHRLQNHQGFFVKREDDFGFCIAGGKGRKFASLIPWLKKEKKNAAILIGSEASNNVLAGAQLLRQNGIKPILVLRESRTLDVLPNSFFSSLFVPESDRHYLDSEAWKSKETFVKELEMELSVAGWFPTVIPEGACFPPALAGALTLGLEIQKQEQAMALKFSTLYSDSGSGWSAAALLISLALIQRYPKVSIYLAAGNADYFQSVLQMAINAFEEIFNYKIPALPEFDFLNPEGKKFQGKMTQKAKTFILEFARTEGLLLDPFYNYGLFSLALERQGPHPSLIIASGGNLSLLGYPELMEPKLKN